MWSFGILLYQMTCGQYPHDTRSTQTLLHSIQEDDVYFPEFMFSKSCKALVLSLLREDPPSRLTANQTKQHSFFRSVNWSRLESKRKHPPYIPDKQTYYFHCEEPFFEEESFEAFHFAHTRTLADDEQLRFHNWNWSHSSSKAQELLILRNKLMLSVVGLQITSVSNPNRGKLLFSLDDLELHEEFMTDNGAIFCRVSETQLIFDGVAYSVENIEVLDSGRLSIRSNDLHRREKAVGNGASVDIPKQRSTPNDTEDEQMNKATEPKS